jgi:hypothetical protein
MYLYNSEYGVLLDILQEFYFHDAKLAVGVGSTFGLEEVELFVL